MNLLVGLFVVLALMSHIKAAVSGSPSPSWGWVGMAFLDVAILIYLFAGKSIT